MGARSRKARRFLGNVFSDDYWQGSPSIAGEVDQPVLKRAVVGVYESAQKFYRLSEQCCKQ